jgi:hypothetical protein
MTPTQASNLDTLGNKLGTAALTTLIRLCPEIRTASDETARSRMRGDARQVGTGHRRVARRRQGLPLDGRDDLRQRGDDPGQRRHQGAAA